MINKTTIIDAAIKANILIKNNRSKFPSDLFEGIEQLDQLTSFPAITAIQKIGIISWNSDIPDIPCL